MADESGCNSALVFYHFGSVDDVLLAALTKASKSRLIRYQTAFDKVDTPTAAIRCVKKLWQQDNASPDVDAIRELVASHSFAKHHQDAINAELTPWFDFVEIQINKLAPEHPLLSLIKPKDIAFAVLALAMGVETLQRIKPGKQSINALFGSAEKFSQMFDGVED